MSPNRSADAVAKRMLREAKQLSNEHKGGMAKKKGGDAGGIGKQTGGDAGCIGKNTGARVGTRSGKLSFTVPRLAAALVLSEDTVPGKDPLLVTEVRAVVPATHALLAAACVVTEVCAVVPATHALLAAAPVVTEVRAVVPATHALLAAARVSCISVECVAASCAISDAEEMELAAAHWHLYF